MSVDALGFKCSFSPRSRAKLRLRRSVCDAHWETLALRQRGGFATTDAAVQAVVLQQGLPDRLRPQLWMQWSQGAALKAAAERVGRSYASLVRRSSVEGALPAVAEAAIVRVFPIA
jgi:hypothetical protein